MPPPPLGDGLPGAAAAAGGIFLPPLVNDGAGVAGLRGTAAGLRTAVGAVSALLAASPGYSGVMIDFGSRPLSAGAGLTAVILPAALPASDAVGVAARPEAAADEPGEGLYQYAALGRAANLVQIVTYDRHDPGTAPGPIAATAWVQRVLGSAASVIPPSKILVGVPHYGCSWTAAAPPCPSPGRRPWPPRPGSRRSWHGTRRRHAHRGVSTVDLIHLRMISGMVY